MNSTQKPFLRCMLLSLSLGLGYRMFLVVVGRIFAWQMGWRSAILVVVRCVEAVGATRLVLEDDVQGVDDTGNVCEREVCQRLVQRSVVGEGGKRLTTKDGQQQVDEEVGTAAALEEDSERRQHDGADDLNDIAVGAR
jgi:hypothetical protein